MSLTTEWVTVADVDEIAPGERLVFEVGRDWVILFNVGGTYYAVEDRCSHEDEPLAEGFLSGHVLECPKHGATFDITTGEHLSPPAVRPIKWYPARVEGDVVQIAISTRK